MGAKIVKLQLIYKSDEVMPYKDYCKELFALMREMSIIKNKIATYLYLDKRFSVALPIEKDTKVKSASGLASAFASELLVNYKTGEVEVLKNHSSNRSAAGQDVQAKFKKFLKESMGAYAVNPPSFKDNGTLCLHDRCIQIYYDEDNKDYGAKLFLLSHSYAKELGIKSSNGFDYKLLVGDDSSRAIIERIIAGEYKISASNLKWDKRKKKWYLLLCYSFTEKRTTSYDPKEYENNVMGINFGVICPMYMSFNHCKNRYNIEANEIEAFRKQVEARRIALRRQRKYCGDGSIGHGKNKRNSPAMKIDDKIARFRDTCNHKYARYAVDMAIKHQCGIIVIEDLTSIAEKEERLFLKTWSYYDLQNKIEYKAKEAGIKVIKINPQYVSRRCSKCGYISFEKEENIKAPDYRKFHCVECGFQSHVDYNASQNNATIGIEAIIAEQIKEHNSENVKNQPAAKAAKSKSKIKETA
ncbi:MAG: RNA-guided endonuclease TnpB family protein [Oscillospiraceae bacterium]|nr:RNA-guided endonuclease TnpB family protein [Oscillospiraceae bacterium]